MKIEKLQEFSGYNVVNDEHAHRSEKPPTLAWVSDRLLQETQDVWSKAYGRPVGVEEAEEILMNVKHLAEALLKAKNGDGNK
jgi:hypothetical protein